MPQPSWLQSLLNRPHFSHVTHELQSREQQREIARSGPDCQVVSHAEQLERPRVSPKITAYYRTSVGQQDLHRRKNRYIALEPYDRTRVLVPNKPDLECEETETESKDGASDHRYINANWVRELYGGKWWIATQAPLPDTMHAFLTLAMSSAPPATLPGARSTTLPSRRRVHTIVQLTMLVEGGRRRAHPYFPSDLHEHMVLHSEEDCDTPDIHVRVESEETIEDAQCVMTDLRLRWCLPADKNVADQDELQVTHLLYTAWPDFGVPEENKSIFYFARLVERVNNRHLLEPSDDPNAGPPIIVHCSAGVGRTGSFIAFSSLLRTYSLFTPAYTRRLSPKHVSSISAPLIRAYSRATSSRPAASITKLTSPLPVSPFGSLPSDMDDDLIAQEIDSLREQRQSMVQRKQQVIWVYQAVSDAFIAT